MTAPRTTSSASGPFSTAQSWLFRGLVVKTVLDQRKGVITEVHDENTAVVNFSGEIKKMRQADMVKVIPVRVAILNSHRNAQL